MRIRKDRKISRKQNTNRNWLLTDHMPFSVMEAYKSVRTNLIFSLPEESCKKILITSALPGEGKSITAINLALSFAQNKSRVLLIDCDLRLPTTASKLGTKHVPGLTNVLVGIHSMRDALQHFPVGLDYLPAGDIPPNPVELLGTKKMEQLVEELSQSYDYIIFDDPPVEELSDSIVLSKLMSGVVFVVKTGSTTHGSLDSAVSRLQMSGAKILGFIMTQAPLDHDRKYAYKKKYGYGYGYGYASSYANAQKTGEQV